MKIQPLENQKEIVIQKPQINLKVEQKVQQDKIVISLESRAKFTSEKSQQYASIRQKIDSGFYFQKSIAEEIALVLIRSNFFNLN